MLAVGLARWRRLASLSGGIACALLLVVLGGLSTRLVIIHRLTPPPRLQVVQYVLAHFEPQSTRLYAWGTRACLPSMPRRLMCTNAMISLPPGDISRPRRHGPLPL